MRILICPDKFKGSISAKEVCAALKKGIVDIRSDLDIVLHPLADGGDGSIELLKDFIDLTRVEIETLDPLYRTISANYYHSDKAAFIEMASASGLVLITEHERNPMNTSSYGTGLMIRDAISRGFKHIYLFIGGSATNDAGIGIAQALGYTFLDGSGKALAPNGSSLAKIKSIEIPPTNFDSINITVLCDVINPMYGPNGAAQVYAKQKGATNDMIDNLDQGLKNYASVIHDLIREDISNIPGMGAAGAAAASLVGLCKATLEDGFSVISRETGLVQMMQKADLVITGEGKIDETSYQGKVVGNIHHLCEQYAKPMGIVGGTVEFVQGKLKFQYAVMDIADNIEDAMSNAYNYLKEIGYSIATQLD